MKLKITPKLNEQLQIVANTPIGPLYLVASPSGLESIHRKKQKYPFADSSTHTLPAHKILVKAEKQLNEYFKGQRQNFDLPLNPKGTKFQKQVWLELARIPYAKTCSYKDIAIRIKNKNAVRAVGGANGKNPLWVIVPCHRVVAANGTLGGYSGGLSTKKALLDLEAKNAKS